MPLTILRNDITKMRVDAIVNAANSSLLQGGGVCGAIFAAAGASALQAACSRIGHCATGDAVLTAGYALPARYIIHAVGPIWQGGGHGEETQLRACYTRALELAQTQGLHSIAFPLISSGIYGYPKEQALAVAIAAIGAFLLQSEMNVYLAVFDKAAYKLSDALFSSIESYIDDHYADAHAADARCDDVSLQFREAAQAAFSLPANAPCPDVLPQHRKDAVPSGLEAVVSRAGESFSQMLLRLIDERGLTDPEVYKRANLDRKLFSKIRSNAQYRPSKNTALALCVALRLNLDQTADLLRRAGFALSPASRFDLIVEYFLRAESYNIFEINEALFAFDESMLGA